MSKRGGLGRGLSALIPGAPEVGEATAGILRRQGAELEEHLGHIERAEDEDEAHEARISAKRLRYLLDRVSLFGIPWPRRFAPHLDAWEGEAGDRYDFGVEVRLPFVGRLVQYRGQLDLAV